MFLVVLYKSFYYLVPVIAILTITDVNPIGGACGGGLFKDELVEVLIHKPYKPFLADGGRRKVDVGGFACHVLTCCYTSYGCVQCWTSIAAADGYRAVEVFAERFENVDAELLEIADNFECRCVVNLLG